MNLIKEGSSVAEAVEQALANPQEIPEKDGSKKLREQLELFLKMAIQLEKQLDEACKLTTAKHAEQCEAACRVAQALSTAANQKPLKPVKKLLPKLKVPNKQSENENIYTQKPARRKIPKPQEKDRFVLPFSQNYAAGQLSGATHDDSVETCT